MKKTIIFTIALVGYITSCGTEQRHHASDHETEGEDEAVYYLEEESTENEKLVYDIGDGSAEAEPDDIQNTDFNTESYAYIDENDFENPLKTPLSTFSIDVDNASYTNTRRMLEYGEKPPVDAVRAEEFINYFDYDYPTGSPEEPFSIYTELGVSPWDSNKQLLHIGLKGYTIPTENLPPSNLVFLVDVSGSMNADNKLGLLKRSLIAMTNKLNSKDRVSIVVYAGSSGVVLEPTPCTDKIGIISALNKLSAGGSTAGAEGLELAYKLAEENFMKNGNNRVILATDGDFNIGPSSDAEMQRLIEEKRETGIYITVLGFGMGNYKDSKMEAIADHGNGNYFYIDDMMEANNTLVDNLAGTLVSIAKDVKIQVEFNPNTVQSYRLIGYENRLMDAEDFDDDKKDAGEIGAGHTVTALYEIIPGKANGSNKLRYQTGSESKGSDDIAFIKLRYKKPDQSKSELISVNVSNDVKSQDELSNNFKFSAAVAAFAMKLRESSHIEGFGWSDIITLATKEKGDDTAGRRTEFIQLVRSAKSIFSIT